MARIILLLFFISVYTSILFGQRTFAPLNAEWKFEFWSNGGGPEGSGHCYGNHKVLRVDSEKLIDGKNCGVIKKYSVLHDVDDPVFDGDSIIVWNNGDTIFFYEDGSFYPMYVFQGEIGDTMHTFRPTFADRFALNHSYGSFDTIIEMESIIDGIDSVIVDDGYRTIWHTVPVSVDLEEPCRRYGYIVEGIGASKGMLGEGCITTACGCFGYFICYSDPFINYSPKDCEFLTSVKDIIKTNDIKIFPNPSSGVIYINNKSEYTFTEVSVRNMNGQILLNNTFQNSIDVNDLLPGVYLLELKTADGNRYIDRVLKI